MKAKNQKSVNERVNAVKNLRNANKESRTICGAVKIVRAMWKNGYSDAFKYVGKTYEDTSKPLSWLDTMQRNENNEVFVYQTKRIKDESGEYIKDESGKIKTEIVKKVVTIWTPAVLFKVLEQSMNSNK